MEAHTANMGFRYGSYENIFLPALTKKLFNHLFRMIYLSQPITGLLLITSQPFFQDGSVRLSSVVWDE